MGKGLILLKPKQITKSESKWATFSFGRPDTNNYRKITSLHCFENNFPHEANYVENEHKKT